MSRSTRPRRSRPQVDYISVPIVPELLRAKVSIFADLHRKTRQMEQLNADLRKLSARLITMQDEERRRIARDLHDSVGQVIVALSMNNGMALTEISKVNSVAADALRENEQLIQQLSTDIRTISHLLHPPLLDEIGLLPAIKMFADGFSERSKVNVLVELSPEIGRLSPHMEISVFRIVQECLTNVYRHSESKTAFINLSVDGGKVLVVEVRDEGRGMSPGSIVPKTQDTEPGVGVSGMRERVRELGGTLSIESNGNGTSVMARFPISTAAAIRV